MTQGPARAPAPVGIVYNTSMSRPDAALALAATYAFGNKRESKIGAVCVAGAGLDAAIFCDIVARFYTGSARPGNDMLAVGLAAVTPLPPDPAMVKAVVSRKRTDGEPLYNRSVQRISDTSLAEAVLRNGVIFNAESIIVLSAPATWLAKALDISGTKEEYRKRVKRMVIVDTGTPQRDVTALRKLIADWPSPIFLCGPDVGAALMFPGSRLDSSFEWSPTHPVADAYRAFKAMPYDEPLNDLAALHYAVHPESGFFSLSEPGTLSVGDDGVMRFASGSGSVRRLSVDSTKKVAALEALIAIASAALPAAAGRGAD